MVNNSSYIRNYDFVPFNKPEFYKQSNTGDLNGYLEVSIIAINNLHIGSGYFEQDTDNLRSEVIKYDGIPIIPGSALKGAVRNIASAVSESCLPREVILPYQNITCSTSWNKLIKKTEINSCILCDMFGMMGLGSKVTFSDFKAYEYRLSTGSIDMQFSPNLNSVNYKLNGKHIGYKFYKNKCEIATNTEKVKIEYVEKNSCFTGKILFNKLTKHQLSLLLFSLGMDGSINIKLGGFKNDGFGQVNTQLLYFHINDKTISTNKNIIELASSYVTQYGYKYISSITKLRSLLSPA